jgi:hypothetical protein
MEGVIATGLNNQFFENEDIGGKNLSHRQDSSKIDGESCEIISYPPIFANSPNSSLKT